MAAMYLENQVFIKALFYDSNLESINNLDIFLFPTNGTLDMLQDKLDESGHLEGGKVRVTVINVKNTI